MNDKKKTKDQLIAELAECRRCLDELRHSISLFGPSEDVFALMGSSLQMGIYIIQDDKTIFTNSHISSYSGYPQSELKKLSLMKDTVHPDDQKRVKECGIKMLKGIDSTPYEYRIITKYGTVRWLVEKVTSIRYHGARAVLGNTMDITDRKRTEDELLKIKENLELLVQERTKELLEVNASLQREIEKRIQADDALRDREETFRALAENSLDTIMRFDLDCRHIYVNPNVEKETGIPRERFIGKTHEELGFPHELVDTVENAILRVIKTKMHGRIEFQLPSGIWIDWLLVPEFDETGNVQAVMTSARDITERKQTEEALREAEQRFLQVTENAGELIWEVDAEGLYKYCSAAVEKILGYTPEELVGKKHFYDLFAPDAREVTKQEALTYFRNREPFRNFINKNLHKNGTIIILETAGTPILDKKGKLIGYNGTDMDVTERRLIEDALQASERRYRMITEKMYDIVWIANLELRTSYITPSVYNVLGFSQEEIMSRKVEELMTPDSLAVAFETLATELALEEQGLADPDRIVKLQLDYYHKDGSIRCLETVIGAVRNDQGVMTELHGVSRDITERKRMEEKLKETMDILGEAQRIASIGTWEWDVRQNRVWYSEEMKKLFETPPEEGSVTLPAIFGSIKPEFRTKVTRAIEKSIETRRPFNVEYAITTHNQPEKVLQSQGKAFYDAEGKVLRIVGIAKDVTQEKILERQMVHREKLASLGLMISGIAHEVNNSNNFIVFNIPILRDYVIELLGIAADYAASHPEYSLFGMSFSEFKTDIIKLIDNLDHGSSRINGTISSLRDFTSRKEQHIREVVIAEVIDNAENVCHNQIVMSVRRFEKYVEQDIPKILTDGEALEQIIVNLLINALHALDKEESEIRIIAKKGRTWQERVTIEVADNGSGIEPKAINNLFDPFFTTKPFHKGMGLGLYMVKNMLEGFGGRIEVASEPGKGSTFRIVLADIDVQ